MTTRLLTLLCLAFALALPARAQLFGVACDQAEYTTADINYSLYSENFKNEAFVEALPNLRWIIDCEPDFRGTARRNFDRLEEIYAHFAETATDADKKAAYLDSVLIVKEYKVPILQEAGTEIDEHAALIEKARFIQTQAETMSDRLDEVLPLYEQAYEMDPAKTDTYTIQYILSEKVKAGQVDETIAMINDVRPRYTDDAEMTSYLDQWMLIVLPTPEAMYDFRREQLAADPENQELILQVFELADQLDDTAEILRLKPAILEMEPSRKTIIMISKIAIDEGDTEEATSLLRRALELSENDEQRVAALYEIGRLQQTAGNMRAARTTYREVLSIDGDHGPSLIGIGDIYVSAGTNCGGTSLDDQAAFIAAVGYYNRAAGDASVASVARQKAGSYSRYFPRKEALFFKNIQPGSRYTVGGCPGWIGETVTLRTSD